LKTRLRAGHVHRKKRCIAQLKLEREQLALPARIELTEAEFKHAIATYDKLQANAPPRAKEPAADEVRAREERRAHEEEEMRLHRLSREIADRAAFEPAVVECEAVAGPGEDRDRVAAAVAKDE